MQHTLALGSFKVEVKLPNHFQDFYNIFMVRVTKSYTSFEVWD
jgi:hypothetical protein